MQSAMSRPDIGEAHWRELRVRAKSLLGLELTAKQIEQFSTLTRLLLEWNQRMSLTGITDPSEVAVKHYLDSLTLTRVIPRFEGLRLVDVGTGAGFPGLVIAILFPDTPVTLMDATGKKLRFIEHVGDALGLKNISTLHARAEDAGRHKSHREAYDVVTARAVAPMPALMEYTLPLAKIGGQVIAMRGADAYEETATAAKAIETLGGELFTIEEIQLPTLDNPRYLVVIDKLEATPRRYPRQAGTPTRQPIL
ncbi:MAG: 16S rRNA (guanine(527)-N(7))-methyltransferase RsmG [Chloroflexi bacterium]|nr:16S rRNA (guanine(527)-N(7))-methyltransferase RsmG [Chloroflexota bacterium]